MSRNRPVVRTLSALLVLVLGLGFLATACEQAVIIWVTTNADDHSVGSLRNAIDQANVAVATSSKGVLIRIPAGTYPLSICPSGADDDSNATGDLDYVNSARLELRSDSPGIEIHQTCPGVRVVDVRSTAAVLFQNVKVVGGAGVSQGGGMRSNGAVQIVGGGFSGGAATGSPGIAGSTFVDGGDGGAAQGGALWAAGPVTITSAVFSGNTAYGGAGGDVGYDAQSVGGDGGAAAGGAVYSTGKVTVYGSSFTANYVAGGRAGSSQYWNGFVFCPSNTGNGGDAAGGAIATTAAASVTLSTVSTNTAEGGDTMSAGARMNCGAAGSGQGGGASGGGVAANGAIDVVTSTFATDGTRHGWNASPPDGSGTGGAVFTPDKATVINSTIVDDSEPLLHAGTIDLKFATITSTEVNVAAFVIDAPVLSSEETVIYGVGLVTVCPPSVAVVSSTYNFYSDASCGLAGVGDRQATGTDPLLGPLANNGGSTLTRLPAATSTLVDAVPPGVCTVPTDQRGIYRPQGAACDIGAVEQ